MIYILYGTEKYLIDKYIKQLKNENSIQSLSTSIYDTDDEIETILEDANSIDMFGNKKLIIVNNSIIFSETKQEKNIEKLINYIKNPNQDCILIFTISVEKLDERKKIIKEIRKNCIVKEFNNFDNKVIKDMFDDYNIDNFTIEFLKDRVGNNLDILDKEIEKIKIYKDQDKIITKDDILNLTSKNIDTDIFSLIESIVLKDKEKAISIYSEMIKMNEEPIKIIVMLANQFRIMYQSKKLTKMGNSVNNIAELLGIHPYRVKLALEKGSKYSEKDLISNLYKLATLDEEIKMGKKDKYLALELFLISI